MMGFENLRKLPVAAAPSNQQAGALSALIAQLSEIVQDENRILESNTSIEAGRFIERKNAILRDLIVFQRTHDVEEIRSAELQKLKLLLDRNTILLKSSIKAVKEIADASLAASIDEESDKTYSAGERHRKIAS
jgi:hypothetical protein